MDTEVPCKEVSEEVARESLIAISYSVPDKDTDSEALSSSNKDGVAADMSNGGGVDKYMSELISISDYQSPDSPATSPRRRA
ncbi:unnamed protein product [Linum tenue]|uniref:Uncharacterized protein n=1 Tax=Linum tenue TaxID=586396 RepID=A0AAV0K9S1_9ROSI|nr:unnamed protein product [Linum tenue]